MNIETYKFGGKPVAQFLPFRLPTGRSGRFEITTKFHSAGSILEVVSFKNSVFMGMKPARVRLMDDTISHHLFEDKVGTWMTSLPQEVEQVTRQIAKAKGRVLLGGLGLGLAVGILVKNENVKNITVVEKSGDVIKLVNRHLPTLFGQRYTMVFEDDIKGFLRYARRFRKKYDFAYYDTWQLTGEHNMDKWVLPLRKLSIGVVEQENIQCWNETEMKGKVAMGLDGRLMSEFSGHNPDMSIFRLNDAEFMECRPQLEGTWTYLNWFRKTKPTAEQSREALKDYLASMSDANQWKARWQKWNREVKT